jgi:peroxidase
LLQQFEALRDGDRFWYELDFKGRDRELIRNTTLAHIISRNTGVRNMQPNVFLAPPIQ